MTRTAVTDEDLKAPDRAAAIAEFLPPVRSYPELSEEQLTTREELAHALSAPREIERILHERARRRESAERAGLAAKGHERLTRAHQQRAEDERRQRDADRLREITRLFAIEVRKLDQIITEFVPALVPVAELAREAYTLDGSKRWRAVPERLMEYVVIQLNKGGVGDLPLPTSRERRRLSLPQLLGVDPVAPSPREG
jgi:hypothetical protein